MCKKNKVATKWFTLLVGVYLGLPVLCPSQSLNLGYVQTDIPETRDKAADEVKRVSNLAIPPTQFEVEQEYTDAKRSVQECGSVIANIDASLSRLQDVKQAFGNPTVLAAAVLVFSNDLETLVAADNATQNSVTANSTNQISTTNATNATGASTNPLVNEAATNKAVVSTISPDDVKLSTDFKRITDQIHQDQLIESQDMFYDTEQADLDRFIQNLEQIEREIQDPPIDYENLQDLFFRCFPRNDSMLYVKKMPVAIDSLSEKFATKRTNAIDIKQAWSKRTGDCSTALLKFQNGTATTVAGNLPWLMTVLAVFGAVVILLVKSFGENIQMEWVASGQVIQLLTVVTLLLIILCLALSDIIKENTVGTLLGGIGGYVLSQGIGRAAGRAAVRAASNQSNQDDTTRNTPSK